MCCLVGWMEQDVMRQNKIEWKVNGLVGKEARGDTHQLIWQG